MLFFKELVSKGKFIRVLTPFHFFDFTLNFFQIFLARIPSSRKSLYQRANYKRGSSHILGSFLLVCLSQFILEQEYVTCFKAILGETPLINPPMNPNKTLHQPHHMYPLAVYEYPTQISCLVYCSCLEYHPFRSPLNSSYQYSSHHRLLLQSRQGLQLCLTLSPA